MAYFTHYWKRDTARDDQLTGHDECDHTASNGFREAGVQPGDTVYVTSFWDGRLHVLGRMVVGEILDLAEAQKRLSYDVWKDSDHLIAREGSATPMTYDTALKPDDAERLEFIKTDGAVVGPRHRQGGRIEPQSFRGVREITAGSASVLDSYLEGRSSGDRPSPDDTRTLLDQAIADLREDEGAETRETVLRSIAIRQGQQQFRDTAMKIWQRKCAVTRCDTPWVLEAAHTRPYSEGGASIATNCVLLRSDVHTLFDLRELAFDLTQDGTLTVELSPDLRVSKTYARYHGRKVELPEALRTMFRDFARSISAHRAGCSW